MGPSKSINTDHHDEFIRSLEATTELVQQLLRDIRDGEVDFAAIKTELRILVDNVKELSTLIKENESGISSLETKVALLEKAVAELEEWMKFRKQREEEESFNLKTTDKTGQWQIIAAIITGGLALLTALATLLISLLSK